MEVAGTPAWETAMATGDGFRQYAQECLRWADQAKTEEECAVFLDMARDWTLAAMRLNGVSIPDGKDSKAPSNPAP
jgi:hypothetical protein